MPYSITREDPERDLRALRAVLSGFPAGISSSAIPALQELADSIEEQVKPEEPIAFGSVVKARSGTQYVRVGAAVVSPWVSGDRACTWDELDVVEVLRIGVGELPSESQKVAQDDAYGLGLKDAALYLRKRLIQLRSSAITAERQDAYDKAIAAVEALS